jgi:threonine/homoserine/homoserine lactone efflux protein
MRILSQIVEIFVLGAIGGAIPGPMLTAVFTEVVSSGFHKSIRVILRGFASETIVAGSIFLAFFSISIPEYYFYVISLVGAAFLVYLSYKVWKIDRIGDERGGVFSFSKMFLLTLTNGAFWIIWITVCVPRAFVLNEQILGGKFIFLAAFQCGWTIMTSILAFIFSRFRPLLLQENLVSPVFKFFALVLVIIAMRSVYESLSYL